MSSGLGFAVYLVLVLLGGGLLGAWLVRWGMLADEGWWSDFVAVNRGDRIMRRVQTVVAILLAPWLLRCIGWRGLGDLGWSGSRRGIEQRWDVYRGFLFGLLAMGSIFAVALWGGYREMTPSTFGHWMASMVTGFLITGLGVGIIEETLTRGVLYRSMARSWGPWAGALVSSLIFAYVHFMKASPESLDAGAWAAVQSSLSHGFVREQHGGLKFLNLFLFGMVLCRMVYHRGDIWYAVGLHASAVGMIRVISKQSERVGDRSAWIGHSAKFDDGWMLTVLLILLWLGFEIFRSTHSGKRHVHF